MAYSNHSEARANGWFSRRNKGMDKLQAYQATRDGHQATKLANELARTAAAAKRLPQDQLKRLDSMLGAGKGAVRERKRLNSLLGK